MTGFGRCQTAYDGIDLSVEISSVNRRTLEMSISMPREWQSLEREIQDFLRSKLNRGKLHIQVMAVPAKSEAGFYWDETGLQSSLARLAQCAADNGIEWSPSSDALIRIAALNKVEMVLPDAESVKAVIMEAVSQASGKLIGMRSMEGESLKADLQERLEFIINCLAEITSKAAGTVDRYGEMLLQRLNQSGLDFQLSDERVLKEIAIFADKCDVSEEVTRLNSHMEQFGDCLQTGSPIGRKLEFLLQEVNREFNTIGSKANNIEVSRLVIEAKNEIERIREQIQNIE